MRTPALDFTPLFFSSLRFLSPGKLKILWNSAQSIKV